MKYYSTRGFNSNQSFSQIILEGLAPDGGLYMPRYYPQIYNKLAEWKHLSYGQLAYEVIRLFCDDIPSSDLQNICLKTYTYDIFKYTKSFENPNYIAPLTILGKSNIALLALSNGPTLAFKDMAMQFLGNLFEYILEKNATYLNIVGATSGDTGSAAEYAVKGRKNLRIFMLSPYQKMSAFQQAQMFSLNEDNIFNLAIDGFFDNCQDIVKNISNDIAFKSKYKIGTVNSINWARIVAQIVYYVHGYLQAIRAYNLNIGDKVNYSVPSGNFGNVCAGHIARQMGLPINKLIVATNENNVLDIAFSTGIYCAKNQQQTMQTSSPSMDISKASNFERFVFDYNNADSQKTVQDFNNFNTTNCIDFATKIDINNLDFKQKFAQFGFISSSSSHAHRLAMIADVYARYNIIIDPHTADGIKAANENIDAKIPTIVLETAQAIKFSSTINDAIGITPPIHSDFKDICSGVYKNNVQIMPSDTAIIKQFIVDNI